MTDCVIQETDNMIQSFSPLGHVLKFSASQIRAEVIMAYMRCWQS